LRPDREHLKRRGTVGRVGAGQILGEIVLAVADAGRGGRADDIAERRAAWKYNLGDDEKERSRGLFTEL
jgi:hypothetical protein